MVGGYSGGATYDADGEVVGMTTAASSGTGDPVGYAIPIPRSCSIADDLEPMASSNADYAYGYPAFLGIGLGDGTAVQGAYDGTPAADAGIGAGDTDHRGRRHRRGHARPSCAPRSPPTPPATTCSVTWTDASGASHTATIALARDPSPEPGRHTNWSIRQFV